MVDVSNLVVAVAAAIGLVVLLIGRVPFPGRRRGGVLVRLAGAALLTPWPVSRVLAFAAAAARQLDGEPPDKPETVQLLTSVVQLAVLLNAAGAAAALVLASGRDGGPNRRAPRRESGSR